jgi:hypothetical protein
LPAAPADAARVAHANVSAIVSSPPAAAHGRLQALSADAAAGRLNLSQPHRVYGANSSDVIAGSVLAAAVAESWRYLVIRSDDEAVAAVEVTADAGGAAQLAHINEGRFVGATVDAIRRAEEIAAGDPRDYELRLLRIPSLYVYALWLHADDADQLIPFDPAPSVLRANDAYDETAFIAALRPLAEQRLAAEPEMG